MPVPTKKQRFTYLVVLHYASRATKENWTVVQMIANRHRRKVAVANARATMKESPDHLIECWWTRIRTDKIHRVEVKHGKPRRHSKNS